MGNTDSVPVVSQLKSGWQSYYGDPEGARQTQRNFLRGCPIVSQINSHVRWQWGDEEGALDAQKYFFTNVSNLVNGIPVAGHVKGVIHYACGDKIGGNSAMLAATRTTGVVAGGIGACMLGGPAAAFYGGMAAGVAMDGVMTGVDSAIKGEFSPHGHVALGYMAAKGKLDPGTAFDWCFIPAMDGLAGEAYSNGFQEIRNKIATTKNLKLAVQEAVDSGNIQLQEGETVGSFVEQLEFAALKLQEKLESATPEQQLGKISVASVVKDTQGNQYVGYSLKLREANFMQPFKGISSTERLYRSEIHTLNYYNQMNGIEVDPAVTAKGFLEIQKSIRGLRGGQASCAEIHAIDQHHGVNGIGVDPARTISVMHDGTGVKAVGRCWSCKGVGERVSMGQVPTDVLHGTRITADGAVLDIAQLSQAFEFDIERRNGPPRKHNKAKVSSFGNLATEPLG